MRYTYIIVDFVEAMTLFYLSNAKNLINTVINEVFVSKKVHVLLTAPFKISCHIPCQFNEKQLNLIKISATFITTFSRLIDTFFK